jgi:hypothetical protein
MGNDRDRFNDRGDGLPVYEGRMIDRYDYRAKQFISGRGASSRWGVAPFDCTAKIIKPQWYVAKANVPGKLGNRWAYYRIGYGNIADPSMRRSVIAACIPPQSICGDTVPTVAVPAGSEWVFICWLAWMNSTPLDFIARKQLASKHLTMTLLDSFPLPRPSPESPGFFRLSELVVGLMCTGREMDGLRDLLRQQLPGSMKTVSDTKAYLSEHERAYADAEIDAVVAKIFFALNRAEYEFILDSFDVLKRYEEEVFNEFRTKRICLEKYDVLDEKFG